MKITKLEIFLILSLVDYLKPCKHGLILKCPFRSRYVFVLSTLLWLGDVWLGQNQVMRSVASRIYRDNKTRNLCAWEVAWINAKMCFGPVCRISPAVNSLANP